jgi:type II secretion system protein C
MTRYQQEVAEMDRRHARTVRALVFSGAAALAMAALWAADPPIQQWWNALSGRAGHETTRERAVVNQAVTARDPSADAPTAVAAGAQVPAGNDSSVASTPQRLHLISTSPGRNPREGTARIGTDPQNPQTYVADAILVNGSRLAEIHSDRVVLQRGDDKVTLFVPGAGLNDAGSVDLATVPAMSTTSASVELVRGDSLSEVIRSMPYYENDLLQGLQVFPGRQSSVFAQLGLKPGDVVVALDAVAVTDAQGATEYLQALTQGAVVSVRIRRGSTTQTLSLDGTLIEFANAKARGLAQTQPVPPDLGRTFQ